MIGDAPPRAKQKAMRKRTKDEPKQYKIEPIHCDIIKDVFWDSRPGLLV